MSIGINPLKPEIDLVCGQLALAVHTALAHAAEMNEWLAAQTNLVELGYTPDEDYMIKSAFSDLDQLRTIYLGDAALANVKDFRTFAGKLFGFGM